MNIDQELIDKIEAKTIIEPHYDVNCWIHKYRMNIEAYRETEHPEFRKVADKAKSELKSFLETGKISPHK